MIVLLFRHLTSPKDSNKDQLKEKIFVIIVIVLQFLYLIIVIVLQFTHLICPKDTNTGQLIHSATLLK